MHAAHAQLGDANTAIGAGSQAATIATGAAAAKGAIAAAWVPVVGAAIAGVSLALGLIFNRKGPRQKIAATQIVDQLEQLLEQNRDGYLNGPRTAETQQAALKNFDDAWRYLAGADACGGRELGEPGRRCIAERSPGGKWDWFVLYRDPIEEDIPAKGGGLLQSLPGLQRLAADPDRLLVGALLLLGAFVLVGDN